MTDAKPYVVRVKFPGDLEYIPAVRKLVSEMLQVNSFGTKFAFRSEIIVDEVCNNAVTYGCVSAEADVELTCLMYADRIEFQVKDGGGRQEDIGKLREAVAAQKSTVKEMIDGKRSAAGLGLEIVRLLSEEVNLEVDDNNLTSIRVVRRREEAPEADRKGKA